MKINKTFKILSVIAVLVTLLSIVVTAAEPTLNNPERNIASNNLVWRDEEINSFKKDDFTIEEKDLSVNHTYTFENDFKTNSSYYFSTEVEFTKASINTKVPIFVIRSNSGTNLTLNLKSQDVNLSYANKTVEEIASYKNFTFNVNQKYRVTIYTTPTKLSVWIDGQVVFDNIKLPDYVCNLSANPGFIFPAVTGKLSSIKLWSDDEVVLSDTIVNKGEEIIIPDPVTGQKSESFSVPKSEIFKTGRIPVWILIVALSVTIAGFVVSLLFFIRGFLKKRKKDETA